MSNTIELPLDYGYVVLSAFSTFLAASWVGGRVNNFRSVAKIPYPTCYASDERANKDEAAHQFNCAQRAHANFVEHHAPVLGALLLSGLRYPVAASVLGLIWSVNRVIYALGYTRKSWGGAATGRYWGAMSTIAEYVLYGYTAWTGWKMLA